MTVVLHPMSSKSDLQIEFLQSDHSNQMNFKKPKRVSSSIPFQKSSKLPRMALQTLMVNPSDSDKIVKHPISRQVAREKSQLSRRREGKISDLRDISRKKRSIESKNVDLMARNQERVKMKYPPRRKVSARRDFPPQVMNNVLNKRRKEMDKFDDSVMSNAAIVAVSQVETSKDDKDETEEEEMSINERLALCLERAERERRELSEELECFEVVANEFQSPVTTFAKLTPPERENAEIDEQGDSDQAPVLALTNYAQKENLSDCKAIEVFNGFSRSQADFESPKRKMGQQNHLALCKTSRNKHSKRRKVSAESMNQISCKMQDTLSDCSFRSLQPQFPISSSIIGSDEDDLRTREKVREALRLFEVALREISQENRANPQDQLETWNKIAYKAREHVKLKNKLVNTGKPIIGPVPGIEVGDEFRFKMELNIIGLHKSVMGGIDYVKKDAKILATSIVSSGRYEDNLHNSNVLIYTGQGGNYLNANKKPEDQKLERGNLALVNSLEMKNPVRVIRSELRLSNSSKTRSKTYVYDGLYLVEESWQENGPRSKLVFKFKLRRISGQPELSWRII